MQITRPHHRYTELETLEVGPETCALTSSLGNFEKCQSLKNKAIIKILIEMLSLFCIVCLFLSVKIESWLWAYQKTTLDIYIEF